MFPQANELLAGKYRLARQLGQGGMGSVWLAEHLTLHSPVAIKLIDPSMVADADASARFMREAQAAASLRSPHVVQVLDYGVDAGVPFIVMEALEGESMSDRLGRLGRLSPGETAKLMTHIGRAMTRAHEAGIVHRDLKPENVFIVRNDDEELAKVLDFGVAKSSRQGGVNAAVSSATRTGAVLGTPYYMSPEQAEGTRLVDHRADIWAMGVMAHECLLGVRPFRAETLGGLLLAICARELPVPSQLGPVVPGFDHWFARACSRDLAQRFQSAREAATDLRRICEPTQARAQVSTTLDAAIEAARAGAPTPVPTHEFARTTGSVVTPPRAVQAPATVVSRRRWLWFVPAGALLVVALAVGARAYERGNAPSTASARSALPVASAPNAPKEASALTPAPPASAAPSAAPTASVSAAAAESAAPALPRPASTAGRATSSPGKRAPLPPPASPPAPLPVRNQPAPVNLGI